MPRVKYFSKTNEQLPGVTSICDRFSDKSGLTEWKLWMVRQGKDPNLESKHSMNVGTLAHAIIDKDIGDAPPIPTAQDMFLSSYEYEACMKEAEIAKHGFSAWVTREKPEFVATEVSLVSDEKRFGGTFDALCIIDGKLTVVDWKTSAKIYPQYETQVAAYAFLLGWGRLNAEQSTPHPHGVPHIGQLPEQFGILRLDKKTGKYEWRVHGHKKLFEEVSRFLRWRDVFDLTV